MNSLYCAEPVRHAFGDCLRPGGTTLTRRILSSISLKPDCRVLDAGCGPGGTIRLFEEQGFNITGVDINQELLLAAEKDGSTVVQANLTGLPFLADQFDMLLSECAWNLTEKELSLKEFHRVLKPGGWLAINDIYSRSNSTPQQQEWPVKCCFSAATDMPTIQHLVERAGFHTIQLEDHTRLLTQAAAEFVFTHGSLHGFWQTVTGNVTSATKACQLSASLRPGLYLLIAQKRKP